MKQQIQRKQEELALAIADLLVRSGAYQRGEKERQDFINIDTLWVYPHTLKAFSELLSQYIKTLGKFKALLVTTDIQSPYGLIPVASLLSVQLSLPLEIWTKGVNVLTETAHFFQPKPKDELLILRQGNRLASTPLDVIWELNRKQRQPAIVLTLVDWDTPEDEEERWSKKTKKITGKSIDFLWVVTLSELRQRAEEIEKET